MHHGEIVEVSGVAAAGEAGRAMGFGSSEDYKQELEVSRQENERLRMALAESEARRERERLDAEIGRKCVQGQKKEATPPRKRRDDTEK
jgi:hypothetical protein